MAPDSAHRTPYANCGYSLLSLHHTLASLSEVHCGKKNGLGGTFKRNAGRSM